MAIRTIVTRGFGNGTFNGTITDVTLKGYSIGEALSNFLGSGLLMYSKDGNYYILNTGESSPTTT